MMTDTDRAADLLSRGCELTRVIRDHTEDVERLMPRRRRLWLEANRAGVTYAQIAEACTVSVGSVAKEIGVAIREFPDIARKP